METETEKEIKRYKWKGRESVTSEMSKIVGKDLVKNYITQLLDLWVELNRLGN